MTLAPSTITRVPMEWAIRREPCPKCGNGVVSVTHRIRRNGWGGVVTDTPVSAAGCRTHDCGWYDVRTEPATKA